MSTPVRTTCPYCGVGCGVLVTPQPDGSVSVQGDPDHPANYGRLCGKGAALAETLDLDGRLLAPQLYGQTVSWDVALNAVADGLRLSIQQHGPQSVAFYVSGQLLSEDYYVANKLMKGFLGSANIDTNSRLCMSSSVAGHTRAFGEDVVPGRYSDLEQADLIVLVGSNLAWCHPVLFQRMRAAREQRQGLPKIVVIDPRRSASAEEADLHLAIAANRDTTLFNGLLVHLHRHERIDGAYLDQHVQGYWSALQAARADAASIPEVARQCGLSEAHVAEFYALFAGTERVVTVFSQGVNQSSRGSDKVNAIINVHLATGRIGRPGMGPFSVTGQPNAMGGREVGGLANQLAAHIPFDATGIAQVERFWHQHALSAAYHGRLGSDHLPARVVQQPGLKAVELFDAVASGEIKVLWIMGTNPVVSMPEADNVRAALANCPLVIVSDCVADTDTLRLAHIRLPALTWGEKDGTVTNSERCIARQRAFLPAPGQARADWWIVTQVARRLGFAPAFPYSSPAAIFREHAALSGFENHGQRGFDISACAELSDQQYQQFSPRHWPIPVSKTTAHERFFSNGGFYTPQQRGHMLAIAPLKQNIISAEYPLVMNSGRVRDHWHTLTRTAKSARLSAHTPEPFLAMHPVDALALGLNEGQLAEVESQTGKALLRLRLDEGQSPGSVFAPMHWGSPHAKRGRINPLVAARRDPLSGQPELKYTAVRLRGWRPLWQGFVLSRTPLELPDTAYSVHVRGQCYWRYELADTQAVADWARWAAARLPAPAEHYEWLRLADPASGRYRLAALEAGQLALVLCISPDQFLPRRDWLSSLFLRPLTAEQRHDVLAGRPSKAQGDTGPMVCSCRGVGRQTLLSAIREQGAQDVQALGKLTGAGTQCGSCVPELRRLLAETRLS